MKRTPLVRKTPLRAHSKLTTRKPMKTTHSPTGPDKLTVDATLERDHFRCAIHGGELVGERGHGWSIHHRRPRQMGGTDRQDANEASNLLAVCGSGVDGCHGLIEGRRAEAYERGWLLHSGDVPSQCAVQHAQHGWCYLTDDAAVSIAPPPILRGDEIDLGDYWPGAA